MDSFQPDTQPGPGLELIVGEVLFDLDGTLIDSLAAVEDAWRLWAESERVTLPPGTRFHGRRVHDLVASLVPADRVLDAVARLTELERHPHLPVLALPGAVELLSALPPERWAVVTSAARSVALARLSAAGMPPPPLLVTGEDVRLGKPAPDPFIAGRRWAGTDSPAVAFEDTPVGLRSAREAGCLAVGVCGISGRDELRDHADAVVGSLSDVTVLGWDDRGIRLRLHPIA